MLFNLLLQIHVVEATGLPSAYSHSVFLQYKFWGQSEPTTLAPLQELKFNHTQVTSLYVAVM